MEFLEFLKLSVSTNISIDLPIALRESLEAIAQKSENNRGVFTVVVTSLWKKTCQPSQDVRRHQAKIPGGYSGRTLDTQVVTPALLISGFPAMAESGWLTRSLEQSHPFDMHYPGQIKPKELKHSFLQVLEFTHTNPELAQESLLFLLKTTHALFVKNRVGAALPQSNVSRNQIVETWIQLMNSKLFGTSGASRIPVLALFSCLQIGLSGFSEIEVDALESHTSPDLRSKVPGDVVIRNIKTNQPQTAFEVKHGKPISLLEIEAARRKVINSQIRTYVMLTDQEPIFADELALLESQNFYKTTGVDLLALNITSYLRHLLATIPETKLVLSIFSDLMNSDKAIKTEHRVFWNRLIDELHV